MTGDGISSGWTNPNCSNQAAKEMTCSVDRTADPVETPGRVLDLLREQLSLYGKLETCASRQRPLIADEDAGPLLSLLAERQKVSVELADVAARLEPIRRSWEIHRRRFSSQERREADRLLTEIKGRLQRLVESDEEDTRLLSARKQAAAQALGATHSTGQALWAYRSSAERPGRLDHVDEAG